jgi:hypothetical protein
MKLKEGHTNRQKEKQTGNPYHDNLLWRNCDFNQFVDETRITTNRKWFNRENTNGQIENGSTEKTQTDK